MSTATLASKRVTHARVPLPAWGIWWAEASLDEEVRLSGRVILTVADLALSGTVMSGGPGPIGRSRYRIAAGAGAWGKTIPARHYANDAGVKAATVVADAASACGETLDLATVPATRLGPAYTRGEGPAARVLESIFPSGWYVGEDGVTRIGKRPTSTLIALAAIQSVDAARGTVALASDEIARLVPGVVVEGITAVDVLHELAPGSALRSTIWGAGIAPTSRRLTALRRIFDQLDPDRRFRGVYEYRVVSQEAERVNLQAIRVSLGLPNLQRVPVRAGVPGARADLTPGSRVLVAFVDASPSRPAIVGFEDPERDGFAPLVLDIDATDEINLGAAAGTVIRDGDTVSVGSTAGVISITVGQGVPPAVSRVKA